MGKQRALLKPLMLLLAFLALSAMSSCPRPSNMEQGGSTGGNEGGGMGDSGGGGGY